MEFKNSNLHSIDLNNSDAMVLSFRPFPHVLSFAFQNWASPILDIHLSLGGQCTTLVSDFVLTSSVSMSSVLTSSALANLMVHWLDNAAFVSHDSPLLFTVALVVWPQTWQCVQRNCWEYGQGCW